MSQTAFQNVLKKIAFVLLWLVVFSLGLMKPDVETPIATLTPTDLLFPVFFVFWILAIAVGALKVELRSAYLGFMGYFVAVLVSALGSVNQELSLGRVAGVAYLILLAVAVGSIASTTIAIRSLIVAWLCGAVLPIAVALAALAVYYFSPGNSILEHITYHQGSSPFASVPRVNSTFITPSMLCSYLTVTFVLIAIARRFGWIGPGLGAFLILTISIAAAATVSIGFGGFLLAAGLWIWSTSDGRTTGRIAFAFSGLIALGFILLAPFSLTDLMAGRFEPSARFLIWQDSVSTFLRDPILGRGFGTAAANLQFQNNDGSWSILTDAHNIFLNAAATSGMFGLIALVVLIVVILRSAFAGASGRGSNFLRVGLGIAFVSAFLYQGLLGSLEDARHVWVLMGLIIAAEAADRNERTTST